MSDKWKLSIGTSAGKDFINIYYNNTRFRYWNGNAIGVKLKVAQNPELLKSAFELKLIQGWKPEKRITVKKPKAVLPPTFLSEIELGLQKTLQGNYSFHHKRDARWVFRELQTFLTDRGLAKVTNGKLKQVDLEDFVYQNKWSNRTQKNVVTTLKCITKGDVKERFKRIKTKRSKSTLHKPIKDVSSLLNDVKEYNYNLYLACLLTYGCLLRPHQEIRLLRWSDIDLEKGLIALSGNRNKSGRNRIIPVAPFVKKELLRSKEEQQDYLFSKNGVPYCKDYFSSLWRRYKKVSSFNLEGITLYSFRHTGAINVFEKTGSLLTLQQVMAHSDMKVSLNYLRGLEIQQIDVNDLPEL
jgi:integrase